MLTKIKYYWPILILIYFIFLVINFSLYLEQGKTNYLKLMKPPVPYYKTLEKVKNLLDANIYASTSFVIRGYQRPPLYVLSHMPNSKIIFEGPTEGIKSYRSDKFGFNNNNQVYEKKNNRIILIGDSFVHGYHVNEGNDIASHLRNLGHNTINLGQGGNGPIQNLAIIREYAIPLKPKKIFWFFYNNDLIDMHRQIKQNDTFIFDNYIHNQNFSQNLINQQKEIINFWSRYDRTYYDDLSKEMKDKQRYKNQNQGLFKDFQLLKDFFFLKELRNFFRNKEKDNLSGNSRLIIEENLVKKYFEILNLARKQSGLKSENFIFVFNRNQKIKNISHFDLELENEIYYLLDKNNYNYLNLNTVYEGNGNKIFPYHDGFKEHPNSLGYNLIAKELDKYLNN